MAERNRVVFLLLCTAAIITVVAAVSIAAAAPAIPKAAAQSSAPAMSIQVNAPILKAKPGESAVKNIVVYATGVDSMQVTGITFGEGSELFRLGSPLPLQAALDPATGKLKAEVPLIVTLPSETQKDSEYPFTVTATSGQQSVRMDSRALVVVATPGDVATYLPNTVIIALYIVMAAGGVFCIFLYKRVAARKYRSWQDT